MAGGFGTRLRPLTNNLPKPLVPMATRPIIDYIVELLRRHSIEDLTTLLYFQPESITSHLGDGSDYGVRIDYVTPDSDLGTAGAVAFAARGVNKSEPVLVISGDVLTDFDLAEAVAFHRKRRAVATIVLTRVENPLAFGIVITDKNGRILRFLEKPGWGEVFSDTINTGIYILEPQVMEYIPGDREFDFSKDLFPRLLADGKPLYGYVAEGYWRDVGSLEEYRNANMDILQGRVKVEIPGSELKGRRVWTGEGARIDFTTDFEGAAVIGRRCRIGAEARIVNSVIGDDTVVEDGAVIINSILWDDVKVGRGASLQENVICSHTTIGDRARLAEGVVVSDHCRIGRNSFVRANVKVWPYKIVEDDATLASSLVWGERWSKNIFSTYGVTGLANIELSPEFAAKLGAAYGASLKKGSTVSTSRDAHKTSRMINRAIMTGILSTGINVHDYGVTPIPVVRFLARSGNETGGIHTRRSPFDPELVDLKFFDNTGLDLHPGAEKTIERLFYREDYGRVRMDETGEMFFPVHGFEHYQSGFMSAVDGETIKRAGFKMVLDYSYGSSTRIFPSILGKLDCEVIALNANIDGAKVTKSGEEFRKSLTQLASIVRSLDADIGVLLDSGGEKIFLVDEAGDILDGPTALNLVTLLTLRYAKSRGLEGAVAVPVSASRSIEKMAANYGYEVVRTKTTPRGVMEAAASGKMLFVGEEDGGYIFPHFMPCFDGMFAIVRILEMLAAQEAKLHRLMREIPPSIMVRERIHCPWEKKGTVMRLLTEDSKDKETLLLDGIRLSYGDDWVLAYPSQDQPCFHIVAEASTEEAARKLIETYSEKIRRWQEK